LGNYFSIDIAISIQYSSFNLAESTKVENRESVCFGNRAESNLSGCQENLRDNFKETIWLNYLMDLCEGRIWLILINY